MELVEGMKTRRSIRKFKQDTVSHETVEKILETAAIVPSWKNSQTAGYVVVENRALLEQIAKEATLGFTHNEEIILGCAALVVMTAVANRCGYEKDGSYTTSKKDKWEMFDAGIAAQTFMLAAHEQGVGSVVLGIFDEDKVSEILNLPEDKHVSCLIPIGYPDETPAMPKKRTVEELVVYK
jgi:nitroreductase